MGGSVATLGDCKSCAADVCKDDAERLQNPYTRGVRSGYHEEIEGFAVTAGSPAEQWHYWAIGGPVSAFDCRHGQDRVDFELVFDEPSFGYLQDLDDTIPGWLDVVHDMICKLPNSAGNIEQRLNKVIQHARAHDLEGCTHRVLDMAASTERTSVWFGTRGQLLHMALTVHGVNF